MKPELAIDKYQAHSKDYFLQQRTDQLTIIQGTLTIPEHLVSHPLQGALYCIGCSLAWFLIFYTCCLFDNLLKRLSSF